MAPPLSSFVRRVCGCRLPVLPIRSLGSPFLRFSTSIHSQILGVLESDISGSSSGSTQEQGNGGEVPFKVEEDDFVMCFLSKEDDESLIFRTGAVYNLIDPGSKVYLHGFIRNDFHVDYGIAVRPADAIVHSMTIRNVVDVKMKGFEKVFDNIGINRSMIKFLLGEFEKQGFQC